MAYPEYKTQIEITREQADKQGYLVKSCYRFPNNMVVTFDHNGKQIPELQGEFSMMLYVEIQLRSDSRTEFNGF